MIKNYIIAVCFVVVAAFSVAAPQAHAATSNIAELMKTLQTLMAKVEELKSQLAQVRGEIKDELKEIK